MSKTRMFKMGHADVFQDKPSEETRRAVEAMGNDIEKCGLLVRSGAKSLSDALIGKSEAELIAVIKFLVKEKNNS